MRQQLGAAFGHCADEVQRTMPPPSVQRGAATQLVLVPRMLRQQTLPGPQAAPSRQLMLGPGQVDRFEMHVWVHRKNPDGPLAIFNPNVRCL